MVRNIFCGVAIVALLSSPVSGAFASESGSEIQEMQHQIKFLMQEVERLKTKDAENVKLTEEITRLKQEQQKQQAANKAVQEKVETLASTSLSIPASSDAASFAALEPAAGPRGASFETTMNPSPKFTYGDFSWRPFGTLQADFAFFNDDQFDHPDGAEMRRLWLGMQGDVAENIGYVFLADLGNAGVTIVNAFMSYKGFDNGEIRLGHNRSPYSLEGSTNTDDTTFIEFSPAVTAFDVGEIVGLGGFFHGDYWSASAGIYNQSTALQDTDDEGWRVAGRFAVNPIKDDENLIHLGGSLGYVASRDQTNSFTFGAPAANVVQTTNLVQATVANADSHTLYGLEAAAVYGPLSIQGEYIRADVDFGNGAADATLDTAYAQVSYFLTGERRPYVDGNGTFGRVIPNNDFIYGDGWGAWEVAARVSNVDLNDGNVTGGEMDSYTLGVNWYLNPYAKLMLNYIDTDTDANAFSAVGDSPSLVLLRGQVVF